MLSCLLAWMWLCVQADPASLSVTVPLRVTQTTSWTFFDLPYSEINAQYWALLLSVINSDAQLVLMVRTSTPPELHADNFTADFLDRSSWQFNLTSHLLSFEPYSLGDSSAYAGVYFYGSSPGSSAAYQLKVLTSPVPFCPSDCSGQGTCESGVCACRPGFVGIDCRIPVLEMRQNPLTTTLQRDQWQLVTLPGQANCKNSPARVTMTAQASSEFLALRLYMSSAKSG